MDWIKVTPETMPPDMEPILITVKNRSFTPKYVCPHQARLRFGQFEICINELFGKEWENVKNIGIIVTHWMPYPKPAED